MPLYLGGKFFADEGTYMHQPHTTLLPHMLTVAYDIPLTLRQPLEAATIAQLKAFGNGKISPILTEIWQVTREINALKVYMHTMSLEFEDNPESGRCIVHAIGQLCFDSQDPTTCAILDIHLASVATQALGRLLPNNRLEVTSL